MLSVKTKIEMEPNQRNERAKKNKDLGFNERGKLFVRRRKQRKLIGLSGEETMNMGCLLIQMGKKSKKE